MRYSAMCLILLLAQSALAQEAVKETTPALIKKLGSANFQERLRASKLLHERPEAAPALRDALRSSDLETAKRARDILDYFERRDLEIALKEGRVDKLIEAVTARKLGDREEESWQLVGDFTRRVIDLHHKKKGAKLDNVLRWSATPLFAVCADRVTESTIVEPLEGYYLRVGEIDIDRGRNRPKVFTNGFFMGGFALVKGPVRIVGTGKHVIIAGQTVKLSGIEGYGACFIISAGDIVINEGIVDSLLIARGKVTCGATCENNHIISGKSIVTAQEPVNCILSENEANPLGFIRWSDSPKAKPIPQSKN